MPIPQTLSSQQVPRNQQELEKYSNIIEAAKKDWLGHAVDMEPESKAAFSRSVTDRADKLIMQLFEMKRINCSAGEIKDAAEFYLKNLRQSSEKALQNPKAYENKKAEVQGKFEAVADSIKKPLAFGAFVPSPKKEAVAAAKPKAQELLTFSTKEEVAQCLKGKIADLAPYFVEKGIIDDLAGKVAEREIYPSGVQMDVALTLDDKQYPAGAAMPAMMNLTNALEKCAEKK